jgi:hypothetical protein
VTILNKENSKKPSFEPNEKISVNDTFENNNIRISLKPAPGAKKMALGAGGIKSGADIDSEV